MATGLIKNDNPVTMMNIKRKLNSKNYSVFSVKTPLALQATMGNFFNHNEKFMEIKIDDLQGDEIINLLQEHLKDMYLTSPPESVHALDLDGLRQPEITFWTIWENNNLAGCGALKELSETHAEIKSMRTATEFRRRGVAAKLLQHIVDEAKGRNYQQLSLETGSMAYFQPAYKLYLRFGFTDCEPFSDYKEDPNSIFMVKKL